MSAGYRSIQPQAKARRPRFASIPAVAAIVAVTLMVLGLVYPAKDALVHHALDGALNDPVAEQYVANLLHERPKDKALRMRLAELRLNRGQFEAVSSILEPLLQDDEPEWRLRATRLAVEALEQARYVAPPVERAIVEVRLRALLTSLTLRETNPLLLEHLLNEAKILGNAKLTLQLVERLAELKPDQAVAEYVSLAQSALGRGDYLPSARFYWKARHLESDRKQQRAWYLESLRVLQSGNLLAESLTEAEREMGDLVDDQEVLDTFVTLARAANHPDFAVRYARRMMLMEN